MLTTTINDRDGTIVIDNESGDTCDVFALGDVVVAMFNDDDDIILPRNARPIVVIE